MLRAPGAAVPDYVPKPGTIPSLSVPDLQGLRRFHLVGIGGAGMSGIARLLLARGLVVTGSDLKDSPGLASLRLAGARVFIGHRPSNVGQADAVVISSAIPAGNVEVRHALTAGVPVLMRAQVMAALMRGARTVAVAGTHGKTTTTSMISVTLSHAGLSPTFLIGGDLNESGSGAGHGSGDVFVAEADESDGSFLLLHPAIAVVTNVEPDHLDFYESKDELEAAFARFCDQAGVVVACWDDPGVRRATGRFLGELIRYGRDQGADVRVVKERLGVERSEAKVDVYGTEVEVELLVPGRHNVSNAAAAIAVAHHLGVSPQDAVLGLTAFRGVRRRFEHRGVAGGALFIDDYAHHPTEVAATLGAASIGGRRLVAVFQPHRYTRTRAMWRGLGESLGSADMVVVTDVYGAGEPPLPGVSGKLVVDAVAESSPGKRVVYIPRRSQIAPFLSKQIREGDLVLTLGAGDVTMVGEEMLRNLGGDET